MMNDFDGPPITEAEERQLRGKVEYSALSLDQERLASAAWFVLQNQCAPNYQQLVTDHFAAYNTPLKLRSLTYELRQSQGGHTWAPVAIDYMNWVLDNACRTCMTDRKAHQ